VTFQQRQKFLSKTFRFGFRRRSGDDVLPGAVQRDQRLVVAEPDVGSRMFLGIVVGDVVNVVASGALDVELDLATVARELDDVADCDPENILEPTSGSATTSR